VNKSDVFILPIVEFLDGKTIEFITSISRSSDPDFDLPALIMTLNSCLRGRKYQIEQ
jgi:hypothetical protein